MSASAPYLAVWQVLLDVLESVLSALQHMHTYRDRSGRDMAVIHADVKPKSVLLFEEPGGPDPTHNSTFKLGGFDSAMDWACLQRQRREVGPLDRNPVRAPEWLLCVVPTFNCFLHRRCV